MFERGGVGTSERLNVESRARRVDNGGRETGDGMLFVPHCYLNFKNRGTIRGWKVESGGEAMRIDVAG